MPNAQKSQQASNTELNSQRHAVSAVKLTPQEEYSKARAKRNTLSVLGVLLLAVELFAGCTILRLINQHKLHNRVFREMELRTSGVIELSSGTFQGTTDFGYFFGEGEFKFSSGSIYTGMWENNQLCGVGQLVIPIEGKYTGEFSNSQKNGQGTFVWDDGTIYVGEWKDDQMWGQGEYTSNDGVKYVGTFEQNCFINGDCTFSNKTGSYTLTYKAGEIYNAEITYSNGTTYTGDCNNETLSGFGIMIFANSDQFTGSFENGLRNGQGTYTWASGEKYDGSWENDLMSGTGTYTFADGSYASGIFENNVFTDGKYHIENDFGIYTFIVETGKPISVHMQLTSGTTYDGEMAGGKLTGRAQITYSNGDSYSGYVENGVKTGQGNYKWASGASYDGTWSKDQMHGSGTYYYPDSDDGYKLVGTFTEGKPNGVCTYYETSYTYYKTDWANGKCVKIYE